MMDVDVIVMDVIVNKPTNHYSRWNKRNDDLLIQFIKEDKTNEEIALLLQRTLGSINSRILVLAKQELKNGKTLDEVCEEFDIWKSSFSFKYLVHAENKSLIK